MHAAHASRDRCERDTVLQEACLEPMRGKFLNTECAHEIAAVIARWLRINQPSSL